MQYRGDLQNWIPETKSASNLFLHVVVCIDLTLTYYVLLIIACFGCELRPVTWDVLIDIL